MSEWAEDFIHHKTTTTVTEQTTGNMVFTPLEFHASSDNPLLTKYVEATTEKKNSTIPLPANRDL